MQDLLCRTVMPRPEAQARLCRPAALPGRCRRLAIPSGGYR